MLQTLGQGMNLVAYTPVHSLYFSTGSQVDDTMTEQVENFFANLLGIVPVLQDITWTQVVPNLIQVLNQLVAVGIWLELLGHLGQ